MIRLYVRQPLVLKYVIDNKVNEINKVRALTSEYSKQGFGFVNSKKYFLALLHT